MAELTFKSAGVSTREIDLSQPRVSGPSGIPAGIIGTSVEGPAFVPLTFASYTEFKDIFGAADGEKFGPIAVSEWLSNAQSCTYIRVLGAGDGKKRNTTTGNVTNAGFVVGNRVVQANGLLGDNSYANSGVGAAEGRTYFLGALMSESNGSTIFSEAGIQVDATKAVASFKCVAFLTGAVVLKDAHGKEIAYHFHTGTNGTGVRGGATVGNLPKGCIVNCNSQTATEIASNFALAMTNASLSGHRGTISGSNNGAITHFTQSMPGLIGNSSITYNSTISAGRATLEVNAQAKDSQFRSGSGGAVPILRGVLLAPSGVVLHLSGNRVGSTRSDAPSTALTARATDQSTMARKGGVTGSVNLSSQEFVMLMNGFKGSGTKLTTTITASFDMTSPTYFANVFNTDPLRIEEKGHLLYGHYDVYPDLAAVTGSGAVLTGSHNPSSIMDIGFLLTSSIARIGANASAGSSTVPSYESFEDRFSHAKSPYIISQGYGASPYNLFKIHALSDGKAGSTKFKISIENLNKSTSDSDSYGTFDLIVRNFYDSDDEKAVLESFRGLTLNPESDRYIARVVGDQNIYYNFDNDAESQKIIVEGSHPVRSRFIRIQMSDEMKKVSVPDTALPMGFRGPGHLVTSGSLLSAEEDPSVFLSSDYLQRVVEPPIPYRGTIAQGTGLKKRSDSRLYWGVQSTRKTSATEPNKVGLFDKSLNTYTKHFPNHRKDTTNIWVADNTTSTLVAGSKLHNDEFNNNKFTLENIRVRTGSDGFADPEQWASASYVRQGGIGANESNYTQAFRVDDLGKVGNRKFAKFTFILQGGFNGTNIFKADNFKLTDNAAKREMDDSNQGETAGCTVASFRKATDIMASKTDVDIQLLAIPGMRETAITDYAITSIENRFDAMYIMDIEERDQFNNVVTSSNQNPHVANTVATFKNRSLDSSFAAAYFPDLVVKDPDKNTLVQVPPSVPVLGAYSLNDKIGHPWFAPAGFTRGALSSVEMANVRLNRSNLDDLYDADINPITAFPGTGITVWGQKTLLATQSALDRVNVRRLLISVRRKVKNIANSLLFEPNRSETLEKFSALVNPILQTIQEQSGVDRYKVVIDTSTTTQADVENNTIRGKIFLQPTRSVEFIALDFVVTNAGSNI